MRGARVSLGEATEWQVPQYPQLSAKAANFVNELNRRGSNSLEFTSDEQSYMLCSDTAIPSCEFVATVKCSINERSMQLGLDAGLCALLLEDWLPLETITKLPDDLKKSVIIAALKPLADFFAKHAVGNFNVGDIECQPTQPPHTSLFFNLSSANGTIVGHAFADADEQTINALNKIGQATVKPVAHDFAEQLPVQVEIIMAGTVLSLKEFNKLREDDIILLDVPFSGSKEVYARISDKICLLSVIDENKLIIKKQGGVVMASDEQPPIDQEIEDLEVSEDQETDTLDIDQIPLPNRELLDENDELDPEEESFDASSAEETVVDETAVSEPPPAEEPATVPPDEEPTAAPSDEDEQPSDTQLNDVSDLPVELLFVVDQFKTTVKEIERIKPGYVFELNGKTIGHAEIRANGTPIGSGELVQIEDRTGVRILKLYKQEKKTDD